MSHGLVVGLQCHCSISISMLRALCAHETMQLSLQNATDSKFWSHSALQQEWHDYVISGVMSGNNSYDQKLQQVLAGPHAECAVCSPRVLQCQGQTAVCNKHDDGQIWCH
jgi:hypothetical protein